MLKKVAFLICVVSVLVLFPTRAEALTAAEYENRIAHHINSIRVDHDLKSLRFGKCLDQCAERWARILDIKDRLYHQSMEYILEECSAEGAGEIIGVGDVSPSKMVELWMNSPAHKAVILRPRYQRIGVGAVRDNGRWWVVVDFLYRAK